VDDEDAGVRRALLGMLGAGVRYAMGSAGLVAPRMLSRPTPCPDWDVRSLLDHVSDALGAVREGLATSRVTAPSRPDGHPCGDPVAQLLARATALLAVCAAAPPPGPVGVGDRRLDVCRLVLVGAVEVTVHGWDVATACGADRPVPPGLADVLLPVAPLVVPPGVRPGRFAEPVGLPPGAGPGDRLVAFLGRRPGGTVKSCRSTPA
jgi:uncharacterized protein (TIGR03086 family)